MADSAIGLERSIDSIPYSPVSNADRGITDRIPFSALPGDEPDLAQSDLASLLKMGALQQEAGNDAEAEEFFRKALAIADRTLGPDNPELMLLLSDLTRLYLRKSAFSSAEPLLLRLLEMKRSKGEDHPEVATVLASLANVRQSLGSHESAEQLWRRVLEIRERTLAPNHFAIATALEHLGEACAARGKIDEALSTFQRALSIRERTLGAEHPSMRLGRERIADLQLQASDGLLDSGMTPNSGTTPERFRLLSGESRALTAPLPTVRDRVSVSPPMARKVSARIHQSAAEKIQQPLADPIVTDEPALRPDPILSATTAALADLAVLEVGAPAEPVTYLDALESLRAELETPYETHTIGERGAQLLSSLMTSLGKKQVVAGGVVAIIALLVLAVFTDSHAFGDTAQTTPTSPATVSPRATTPAVTGASVATATLGTNASTGVTNGGVTNVAKTAPPHPPAAEERAITSKKASEKKEETKPISIPTLSNAERSRLDSVAAIASTVTGRINEPIIPAAPNLLGTRRPTFDAEGTVAPTRARLIGELPTPRVPSQVAGVEGVVRVHFTVDTEGRPVMSTVTVVDSPNPLLTTAVRRVIPSMHFEPARTGGADPRPISDVVQVAFSFFTSR
jgi:tetratricopeptide (TPR) repeat protein